MGHLQRSAATGHLLRGANGHLANDCPEVDEPCSDCAGTQPAPTVTVAGTCTSQSECDKAAGDDYHWHSFNEPPDIISCSGDCVWAWYRTPQSGQAVYLYVIYFEEEERFTAILELGKAGLPPAWIFGDCDDDQAITCVAPNLEGTIQLAGRDDGVYDCSGCTATVTFNP